jgi:uncharacterized protein (DUF58 family)
MWWKFRKRPDSAADSIPESEATNATEIRESGRAPLSEVAKRVKDVELVTRKKSSAILSGQYKSRFKGQGMQFADFRVYQYGDDTRHIDWRTSARMQETYVKTFEEERELNIFFAADVSGSKDFGTADFNKREAMAIALASIGFSAIANGDRVGLILFTDRVERFIPAKKGRKHILRIIDELLTFEPSSKGSKINAALDFLSSTLKHGSVLILASDFFSQIDKKKIGLLAKKHDFICLKTSDIRDENLPSIGLLRIEDPETGENIIINTSSTMLRKKYSQEQRDYKNAIEETLKKGGAQLINISTHGDPADTLNAFFKMRRARKK